VPKDFRSPEEIDRAIARLRRRIEEVKLLAANGAHYDGAERDTAQRNISADILEIFGAQSPEYQAHQCHSIWHGPLLMGESPSARQEKFEAGITETVKMLDGLVRRLEEARAEHRVDPSARVRSAFETLELHPRVANAASELYRDGHYRNAVADASMALLNFVKEKSGRYDLDGASLVTTVFSKNWKRWGVCTPRRLQRSRRPDRQG
jgi:hypothetical protein